MAKRMSNKERISQKAEEAAAEKAGKKEKPAKKKKKKTTTRKKVAAATKRQKVVWKVFDANFKEVACFPYPEKSKAYSKADELTKKNSKSHFVNAVNVPMEDD